MKKYKKIILITLLVLFFDLISKVIITHIMLPNTSVSLLGNFFKLTLVHNYGAAWSILTNKVIFLILISIFALIILLYMIKKEKKLTIINNLYYGLIIGGILGNLSNRLFLGYVIDFLDFNIFGYDFPIFNLADSAIVISIILMIVEILKSKEN